MKTTNLYQFKKAPIATQVEAANATTTEFDWYDVFYAGQHTDSAGKKNTFTRADLQQVVDNFAANTVPLVIGHPEMNAPAYGWVSAIRLTDDDRLEIKADSVNVEFAKAVAAKAFPNRSVALERTSKGLQMVHVGHLGGRAPALEGMPWQFSGDKDSLTTFEFGEQKPDAPNESEQKLFQRFLNWFAKGLESEDPTHQLSTPNTPPEDDDVPQITQEQLDAAVKKAADDAAEASKATFAKQLEEANKRAKKAEAEQAAFAKQKRVAECKALVEKSKLLPFQKHGLAEFMAELSDDENAQFTFAKGAGDKAESVKQSPFAFMKSFLESAESKSPLDSNQTNLHAKHEAGDPEALKQEAHTYQKAQAEQGVTVSIVDAIAHVAGGDA